MSTVTPPPPPAPLPPSAPQALVSVPDPPEALLRVPQGESVPVRILEAWAKGMVQVDSPFGRFTVRTSLSLPQGATLDLHMTGRGGGQVLLRIAALDGKPLAHALPELLPAQTGERGGTGALPGPLGGLRPDDTAVPAPRSVGGAVTWAVSGRWDGLSGVVVRGLVATGTGHAAAGGAKPPGTLTSPAPGATGASGSQPSGPAWPTGTRLTVRIAALHPPPSTGENGTDAPAAGRSVAPSGPRQGGSVTGSEAGTRAAVPASPPVRTEAAHTRAAPGAPAGSALPQGAAAGGRPPVLATVTGTVQPHGSGGHTLVRTPAGLVALETPAPLPQGATVTLEVTAQRPPLATAPPGPAADRTPIGTASWTAFSEAIDLVARSDPEAARRLAAALPRADVRLAANMIAFVQAARASDVRAWLGEAPLRALERAGPRGQTLARQLGDAVNEASTVMRDSGGGEWRSLTLPFGNGAAVERIQLITRRHGAEDGSQDEAGRRQKGDKGHRFLINLDLSRLGRLQIDALYKERTRRFDLIIRTRTELPVTMRRDIQGVFARSAETLNLKGGVQFQVGNQFAGPDPALASHPRPDRGDGDVVV